MAMKKKWYYYFRKIINHILLPFRQLVRFSQEYPWLIFILAGIIIAIPFALYDYKNGIDLKDLSVNIQSSIFEVFILGLFVVFYNKLSSRKEAIERFQDEISSYLSWKEPEATYRIVGLIRSLNKLGIGKIFLRQAHLEKANLEETNLEGTNLEESNLKEANLEGANLKGANLLMAQLEEANLEMAHLEEATLWGANLKGANMACAHLEEANLGDAILSGAYLGGGTWKDRNWMELTWRERIWRGLTWKE